MFRVSAAWLAKILVVAETSSQSGRVAPATLAALTAASSIGGPVYAIVAGKKPLVDAASAVLAKTVGVSGVITTEGDHYHTALPEEFSELVNAVVDAEGITHVVAGCTSFGKDVIPLSAAKRQSMPVTDILQVKGETTFVRPMYAGNVLATVESKSPLHFITVRGTAFERAVEGQTPCAVTPFPATKPLNRTTLVSETSQNADAPDLTTASIVLAGGRGLKSKENFDKLYALAGKLHAAVGGTRAAVDSGFTSNENQIGQTGKNVAPGLYMAFGISGAIQHVAGMRDSKVVVAVNKDEEAPIFQCADYGVVADANTFIDELTKKL